MVFWRTVPETEEANREFWRIIYELPDEMYAGVRHKDRSGGLQEVSGLSK